MNLEAVILGFVVVVDASYLFSFDLIFDLSAFFFFIDLFSTLGTHNIFWSVKYQVTASNCPAQCLAVLTYTNRL